jgi:hypothetical protein
MESKEQSFYFTAKSVIGVGGIGEYHRLILSPDWGSFSLERKLESTLYLAPEGLKHLARTFMSG